jgi:hypothetical protein
MDKIPLETIDDESAIRVRECLSVRYIQSAALLCRMGYRIEKQYAESYGISPEKVLEHEAFILNSVLSSVAFLECAINELHADAVDGVIFFADEKIEALLHAIGGKWKNERNFDHAPLLEKYQRILSIAQRLPFDPDDRAFANVRDLIAIRNHLMHYRREWVTVRGSRSPAEGDGTAAGRLEKALRKKFAANPLAKEKQPFFPDRCLGHGCAEWAVVNSLIFADEFFRRLGLPAPYEGVREELRTR